jgi:hypothetical protein
MKAVGTEEIVDYLVQHHPHAKTWERNIVRIYINVYANQNRLECSTSDGETINGIIMWRLVMEPEDARNENHYDPEGACIFIDFCCGYTDEIRRGLLIAMLHQVGVRPVIAWERHGTLRVHTAYRLVQHILKRRKFNYGQR